MAGKRQGPLPWTTQQLIFSFVTEIGERSELSGADPKACLSLRLHNIFCRFDQIFKTPPKGQVWASDFWPSLFDEERKESERRRLGKIRTLDRWREARGCILSYNTIIREFLLAGVSVSTLALGMHCLLPIRDLLVFPLWCSGWRIWCYHSCGAGRSCSSDLISGPETSICCGCHRK